MSGLLHHFDMLMSHLNAREDSLAEETRELLVEYIKDADDNQLWIDCLESAGVDNWNGYDYAQEMYHEEMGNSED